MTNNRALADDLLHTTVTVSPAPGAPATRSETIGELLTAVDRHIDAGNPSGAEHLLVQIHRIAPGSAPITLRLAELYCAHDRHRHALPLLDEILATDPGHVPALICKARTLFHLNRVREAATIAEGVRRLEPDNADNLNNLGVYRMALGDFDAAGEAYSAAIARIPGFIPAYHNLLRLPGRALDDDQQQRLKRLSRDHRLQDTDRALAMFCASLRYRDRADFSGEFRWLDAAKSILAARSPWDADESARLVDEITALERDAIERCTNARSTRTTPIFICSMPRAGSTLTEQLIATHPDIGSAGEAGLATLAVRATAAEHGLDDPHWWRWLARPQAGDLLATARLAFDRAVAGLVPTTRLICDKSINNDIMLGLCLLAFPNARAIACRRDPLDICLSAYQTHLPQLDYTNRLTWLAERYRQHARLMDHWRRLFPGRIIDTDYEALVAAPEEEVARIITAIGLPLPEGGMHLDARNYGVRTASNWQVRQPIYGSSRHRWRRYREQLGEILDLQDHAARGGAAGSPPA